MGASACFPLSVVVCTRDRGGDAAKTVGSILENAYPCFELQVIDQSEDDRTQRNLVPFSPIPCLRYRRSATRGLAAGRNVGILQLRRRLDRLHG